MTNEAYKPRDRIREKLPYLATELDHAGRADLAERVWAFHRNGSIPQTEFDGIIKVGLTLGLGIAFSIVKSQRAVQLILNTPGVRLSWESVSAIQGVIHSHWRVVREERLFNADVASEMRLEFDQAVVEFVRSVPSELKVEDVLDSFNDLTEYEFRDFLQNQERLLESDTYLDLDTRIYELPEEICDAFEFEIREELELRFLRENGTDAIELMDEREDLQRKWEQLFKPAARKFLMKVYAGEINASPPPEAVAEGNRHHYPGNKATSSSPGDRGSGERSFSETDFKNSARALQSTPRIVVLTGAGISAESGLSTFRDAKGLWEKHRIEDVASPRAFATNPDMVHRFYDARRAQLDEVHPNAAHWALSRLEAVFPGDVLIITQNVDDLHEAAMSENVLHMHGRLRSALCTACGHRAEHRADLGDGPACTQCGQKFLRPDIVWFGEEVREGERIMDAVKNCEIFAVIGTSGTVQPAASFVRIAADHGAQIVLINLELHDDVEYDLAYEGLASKFVPDWVREVMLSRGTKNPESDYLGGRNGELLRVIEEFVDGEIYRLGLDRGKYSPEGAPELLKLLSMSVSESHPAMYELEFVLSELFSDRSDAEAGDMRLVKFVMSHSARTAAIREDLKKMQIEYAADLIAWMASDTISHEPGECTGRGLHGELK